MTHQSMILHEIGPGCRLIADLATALELTTDQVGQAVRLLIKRDLVERIELGCFRLTEAGQEAVAKGLTIRSGPAGRKPRKAPERRRPSLQQRAWNVMRMRTRFTVADLIVTSAIETDVRADDTIQRYLRVLTKAGYVQAVGRVREGQKRSWCLAHRLVRDTGIIAPSVIARASILRDHNLGTEVAL